MHSYLSGYFDKIRGQFLFCFVYLPFIDHLQFTLATHFHRGEIHLELLDFKDSKFKILNSKLVSFPVLFWPLALLLIDLFTHFLSVPT